ncbi:MAG: KpsF/GutQ family sugar-phosphate isomerase [Bacteroidales bacterium]|nr:KpsF/GutQ family sugar-phosphate isomerase [Bacteroidales bacterium]
MKSTDEIKEIARLTLRDEAEAVADLASHINDTFVEVVELILHSEGRAILTGIGKSAIIAQKIVATLNSTGTPAIFLHAADALHGDLGTIRKDDVVICLSKSGNTPEIKVLVPLLKLSVNKLVAFVGNTDSYLARQADYIIDVSVKKEACSNNLAPTSSTTAQLAMGDALAVCLLESRGFSISDFARYHPGGSLGKQLYLRVQDICITNEVPRVNVDDSIKTVIVEITSKRLGATAVVDGNQLKGIITDGDIRRMLYRNVEFENHKAVDIMSANPRTIEKDALVSDALNIMRQNNITQLLVVDHDLYTGVIHLHDILKEGII